MNTIKHYMELAKNTKDVLMQKDFAKSSEMFIRKALATNPFISTEIANMLAYDKAVNVCYEAVQNKNCTIRREFMNTDMNHRCIVCRDVLDDVTKCQRC